MHQQLHFITRRCCQFVNIFSCLLCVSQQYCLFLLNNIINKIGSMRRKRYQQFNLSILRIPTLALTIIFAALTVICKGQTANKFVTGKTPLSTDVIYTITGTGLCGIEYAIPKTLSIMDPSISWTIKHSSFSVGPRFILKQKDNSLLNNSHGLMASYQYYIAGNYAHYNFAKLSVSYLKVNFDDFSSGFQSVWHANHYNVELGLGVKSHPFNFFKRLYFLGIISFGITSYRNIEDHVEPADSLFYDNGKYRIAKMAYAHLGIGYDF